jgi:lipopolysaccharide export LptBFGC system permease protein LptF
MNTLDRFIARQFAFNLLVLLVLLFSFVVTVDATYNIKRFAEAATGALKASGETDPGWVRHSAMTVLLIADFWWPMLLQLFNHLAGLVLVGAMGFTLTQLVRHREMVAVLASGVSLFRLSRPFFVIALGVCTLQLLNQEIIIPRLAESGLLSRDQGDAGKRDWGRVVVRPTRDGEGRIWYAKEFIPSLGHMTGVHVWERDSSGRATRRISADLAKYVTDSAGSGWELTGAVVEPLEMGEAGKPAPRAGPPTTIRVNTDIDPKTLLVRRYAGFGQSLGFTQISKLLASPTIDDAMRERLERARWGRFSAVATNLLSLVMVMPFFLLREPRGMLAQSLKAAPVALGSLLGGVLGSQAAVPGLPAAFAVFIPVLVLAPLAVASFSSIKT